jgi:hypothetical protein
LLGELNLISVEKSLNQILDYEKFPFWWKRCHQYGNIANSYSLPIQGRQSESHTSTWNKRTTSQRDETSSHFVWGRGNPISNMSWGPLESNLNVDISSLGTKGGEEVGFPTCFSHVDIQAKGHSVKWWYDLYSSPHY